MRPYYDALFQDLEGTQSYFEFISRHAMGTTMLECACGTGDLLAKLLVNFEVTGIDLDPIMIQEAIRKYPQLSTHAHVGNFLNFDNGKHYDTLVCVGDSINYLHDLEAVQEFVNHASRIADCLILDLHHPYRLLEFASSYIEEGSVDGFDYLYVIDQEEQCLLHTISFMDGSFDQVQQTVFEPESVIKMIQAQGFDVAVYTDFDFNGILEEGEKVMLVCKKLTD